MKKQGLLFILLLTTIFFLLSPVKSSAFRIERVSVASDESEANSYSEECNISADGKFIAYESGATNLVTGDDEGNWDVFVRDLINGTTERVSVTNSGPTTGGNSHSFQPSISSDGRYVAFESSATNLNLPYGDLGSYTDVFVRDRVGGTTTLASVNTGPSGYGGNNNSSSPSISAGGQYVAFHSKASDLGPGGGSTYSDIFVRDLSGATTILVSESSPGYGGNENSYNPSISGESRFVAFESHAMNLANRDYNVLGTYSDIWVWDRQDLSMTLVSYGSSVGGYYGGYGGGSYDPSISADGRYAAFESDATNLVYNDIRGQRDVFVRDMNVGTTTRVSLSVDPGYAGYGGNDWSLGPVISPDGRYVVFSSSASDLVPDDNNGHRDVFVRDLKRGITRLVSKSRSGEQGNSWSEAYGGGLSSDGRYVAFSSDASNLVDGDTNSATDIFMASGFFPEGLPFMLLLLGE